MARILVVDDEPRMRALLGEILQEEGLDVTMAEDGEIALERFRQERPAVVLLDLEMPKRGGMETLPELRQIDPRASVIILTGYRDIPSVVAAMRLGAYDYLPKPFQNDELVLTVRRALERQALLVQVDELRSRVGEDGPLATQMGTSEAIRSVIEQVSQVADSALTVLVQGETGTGKEVVARAIHRQSARRQRPFIALDCGAIPETLIESELFGYEKGAFTGADRRKDGHFRLADGGTLFLDEVPNLPLATQAKLLRVLQERHVQPLGARRPVPVDVRIIAASNVPLEEEMRAGRFRQDLYYRLNEFAILLPPLRERREDILHLARRFLDEASMELRRPVRGISASAAEVLLRHAWPGNARELRNVIRQAALRAEDLLEPGHLGPLGTDRAAVARGGATRRAGRDLSLRETAGLAARDAEQRAIRGALQTARGNKSEAARLLRTDYKTLHLKMRHYGISRRDFLPS
ncbi:MAG: sigma-54-dependent Fis family transcriptional regulator [Candidatus Rokubacteria bacterium]|nr:sigma-54-dependent Fis family transcriptional regulator [Candidatus Rokubacteria bacterium]